MSCRNYRALENSSKCFSKTDPGHKLAQRVELTEANHCMDLLEIIQKQKKTKVTQEQPQESSNMYNENKTVPIEQVVLENDIENEKEIRKQVRMENKKKKKQSFWNTFFFYLLFFVTFLFLSWFMYYVY